METDTDKRDGLDLKCPECRAQLKKPRSRKPDKCKMLCGGCGQSFDICNPETLGELKEKS